MFNIDTIVMVIVLSFACALTAEHPLLGIIMKEESVLNSQSYTLYANEQLAA